MWNVAFEKNRRKNEDDGVWEARGGPKKKKIIGAYFDANVGGIEETRVTTNRKTFYDGQMF